MQTIMAIFTLEAFLQFVQVDEPDRPTVFEDFWGDAAEKVFQKPWDDLLSRNKATLAVRLSTSN
ncbi:MAG: hypothetical protein DWI24_00210 [Planctomycetota bacterium]|nr:MAG: hypothetical protein DWI24_00210 [Planctomycetota bacterium]